MNSGPGLGRIGQGFDANLGTFGEIRPKAAKNFFEKQVGLEDLFLVIMETLGYEVKTSEDLLRSPVQARQVDAPKSMGGGS